MTLKTFINTYKNRYLEWDNSGSKSTNQCVDLAKAWLQQRDGTKVNTGPGMATWGNAKYWWINFPKKLSDAGYSKIHPTMQPLDGDVAVFDGEYGHVSIVCDEDKYNGKTFYTFDQNWPTGSKCKKVNHDKTKLLGFLRREYVVCREANIRAGSSITSKIVDTVPKGTKLIVTGKYGKWYRILYKGSNRYINAYCLTLN